MSNDSPSIRNCPCSSHCSSVARDLQPFYDKTPAMRLVASFIEIQERIKEDEIRSVCIIAF